MLKQKLIDLAYHRPYDIIHDPIRELGLRSITLESVQADLDWIEKLIENCRGASCYSAAISLTNVDTFLESRS